MHFELFDMPHCPVGRSILLRKNLFTFWGWTWSETIDAYLCWSIVPSTIMSKPREYYENIPETIRFPPPTWTLPAILAGCFLSDISHGIRQCASVRWKIKRNSSEKATSFSNQWKSSCGADVQIPASSPMCSSEHRCITRFTRCGGPCVAIF